MVSLFYASYSFGPIFLACEVGQHLSDTAEGIDNMIEQFDWYLFPLQQQRMLCTILIDVQEPVVIACFGDVSCSRETFKKVNFVYKNYPIYLNYQ